MFMSLVRVHLHRSVFAFLLCLLVLVPFLLLLRPGHSSSSRRVVVSSDENINLLDLFDDAFQLVHRAGHAIQRLKTSKENWNKIQKNKKAFQNLPSEPVTLADLLSHTILNQGLKKNFPNLQIVSEEKTPIDDGQIQLLSKQFDRPNSQVKVPPISVERDLLSVPLSSVAVWIDPLDATKEFTENLLQYVMVMLCVTVDKQPTIGILYAPFTGKTVWGWVDVARSPLVRDRTSLTEVHRENIDEIVLSRSHAGQAHELLRDLYRDAQYKIIPAAGSGYKTVQVLEEYADYYLHITSIKKWDVCASDALLRAHHGTLSTLTNRTITYDHFSEQMLIEEGLLATYKRNHQQVLKLLSSSKNLTDYLKNKSKRHS